MSFNHFLKSSEYRPSEKLRELEIAMNTCYDEYARVYYGNEAISSCYIYDLEKDSVTGHEGFWGFLTVFLCFLEVFAGFRMFF